MNVKQYAELKGFTESQLNQYEVRNSGDGVVVPYYLPDGTEYARSRIIKDPTEDNPKGLYFGKGEGKPIPYGLNRPVGCPRGFMWVVEGESDCWTMWENGIPAIGLPGATNFRGLKLEHLRDIEELAVIQEPDDAGRRFPTQVANHLFDLGYTGKIFAVSLSAKDPRDLWLADKNTFISKIREDFKRNRKEITRPSGPETAPRKLKTRVLSSYTPEPVQWLWDQRIPKAKVTLLCGDGGEGKSFITLGIAAAITKGHAMPGGGANFGPRKVLMWNGEDGVEDTIYERAEQAGADLSRIEIVEETDFMGTVVPFSLEDVPLLEQKLKDDPDIVMVTIDPITALLPKVNSAKDAEVRAALQPIADVAKKTGVAIILVMHLKKGEETTVLHRVSGSVAFGALARSVLFVGTHQVSGRKSIDAIKHNLSRGNPDPVEFMLTDDGFRWGSFAPELTSVAIMQSKKRAASGDRLDEAEQFLSRVLAAGPVDSKVLWTGAKDKGISDITLKRAKNALGIVARKEGFGDLGRWTWEMPVAIPEDTVEDTSMREEIFSDKSGLQTGQDLLEYAGTKGLI